MTIVLLNLHNAGFFPNSIIVVAMGIAMGGLARVIAGIFCGLSAIYSAAGQIVNAEYGKTIIPLG